jgi:hypothetical protein
MPTRWLVGIAVDGVAREADTIEHVMDQIERGTARLGQAMQKDRLDQNASDRLPRIE